MSKKSGSTKMFLPIALAMEKEERNKKTKSQRKKATQTKKSEVARKG